MNICQVVKTYTIAYDACLTWSSKSMVGYLQNSDTSWPWTKSLHLKIYIFITNQTIETTIVNNVRDDKYKVAE